VHASSVETRAPGLIDNGVDVEATQAYPWVYSIQTTPATAEPVLRDITQPSSSCPGWASGESGAWPLRLSCHSVPPCGGSGHACPVPGSTPLFCPEVTYVMTAGVRHCRPASTAPFPDPTARACSWAESPSPVAAHKTAGRQGSHLVPVPRSRETDGTSSSGGTALARSRKSRYPLKPAGRGLRFGWRRAGFDQRARPPEAYAHSAGRSLTRPSNRCCG